VFSPIHFRPGRCCDVEGFPEIKALPLQAEVNGALFEEPDSELGVRGVSEQGTGFPPHHQNCVDDNGAAVVQSGCRPERLEREKLF